MNTRICQKSSVAGRQIACNVFGTKNKTVRFRFPHDEHVPPEWVCLLTVPHVKKSLPTLSLFSFAVCSKYV